MKNISLQKNLYPLLIFILLLIIFLQERPLNAQTSTDQLASNKQLLLDFFAFRGSDIERMEQFMAVDYIQHNPRFLAMDKFTGATGSRAWVEARIEARERGGIPLVDLGGIRLTNPIIVMAEDDLVTAIYKGDLLDPDNPEETYEAFAFETFRIRDGKFTEHWDQVTLKAGWMEVN
jgi:predicted SnoaL-like aldol condensation-catalyzing enzyme